MPNWCSNNVHLVGKHKQIRQIMEHNFDFNRIYPEPNYAATDEWYQWRVDHWGTKWNCGGENCIGLHFDDLFHNIKDEESEVWVWFDSAWSPPIGIYEKLVEQGINVEAYYYEPGMNFAGIWENKSDKNIVDFCINVPNSSDEFWSTEEGDALDEQFNIVEALREMEEFDAVDIANAIKEKVRLSELEKIKQQEEILRQQIFMGPISRSLVIQ